MVSEEVCASLFVECLQTTNSWSGRVGVCGAQVRGEQAEGGPAVVVQYRQHQRWL